MDYMHLNQRFEVRGNMRILASMFVGGIVLAVVFTIINQKGEVGVIEGTEAEKRETPLVMYTPTISLLPLDTETVHDSSGASLSAKARETYTRLLRASAAYDYTVLQREIDMPRIDKFRFSAGVTGNRLAVPFWKEQKKETGRDPLDVFHVLLKGSPQKKGDMYIWPRWHETRLLDLKDDEKEEAILFTGVEFVDLLEAGDYYIGPRTAIHTEGVWLYFTERDE